MGPPRPELGMRLPRRAGNILESDKGVDANGITCREREERVFTLTGCLVAVQGRLGCATLLLLKLPGNGHSIVMGDVRIVVRRHRCRAFRIVGLE